MGIFGSSSDQSPQDQVDLGHVNDRLAKLESAVASLQGAGGDADHRAVAAGAANPRRRRHRRHGALPAERPWMDEVRRLKDSGKLINAIKLYREHTGVGLKEAKDIVEVAATDLLRIRQHPPHLADWSPRPRRTVPGCQVRAAPTVSAALARRGPVARPAAAAGRRRWGPGDGAACPSRTTRRTTPRARARRSPAPAPSPWGVAGHDVRRRRRCGEPALLRLRRLRAQGRPRGRLGPGCRQPCRAQAARAFLAAAFATDAEGNPAALARRMGIMYVIWSDHFYPAYHQFQPESYLSSSCRSKRKCSKTLRHRDHMHISLSRPAPRG